MNRENISPPSSGIFGRLTTSILGIDGTSCVWVKTNKSEMCIERENTKKRKSKHRPELYIFFCFFSPTKQLIARHSSFPRSYISNALTSRVTLRYYAVEMLYLDWLPRDGLTFSFVTFPRTKCLLGEKNVCVRNSVKGMVSK